MSPWWVGGSLAMHLVPSGMDPLLQGIRDMVKHLELPEERHRAAMAAIKAAGDAGTLRHRARRLNPMSKTTTSGAASSRRAGVLIGVTVT